MQVGPTSDVKKLKFRIGPLVEWLIRLTPTCHEVIRLISEDMDRPAPFGTRLKVRAHFLICKWCERYGKQLLFMRHAIRRHPDRLAGADPPADGPTLSPEARARIAQAIRDRA
nr:zf-HC2 domain-containing protein [Nitrospirota bacterium]